MHTCRTREAAGVEAAFLGQAATRALSVTGFKRWAVFGAHR